MYCKKCGANLSDGAQFCPQCGSEISTYERPVQGQSGPAGQKSGGSGALVLGILGIIFIFVFSLVGLILCIIAVVEGNKDMKRLPEDKRGQAIAGLVLGSAGLIIFLVSILIAGFALSSIF